MTVSDLNRAIQNIDGRYLEIADAPEKEIIQMFTNKNRKKVLLLVLAACLVMGLGVTAYAYEGGLIIQFFGWGNNLEVNTAVDENGKLVTEAIVHTDHLTEPIEIRNGRLFFIVNNENIDITEQISTEKAYQYEYTDTDGITHFWLVGLLEEGVPEHYGYAEYLKNNNGDWVGGYSARINTEADGHTAAKWLETAKENTVIPW